MPNVLKIYAVWDDEASVWVATSDDVPGLALEASTRDELVAKLQVAIPELLELNGIINEGNDHNDIPFELLSRCTAIAHRQAC